MTGGSRQSSMSGRSTARSVPSLAGRSWYALSKFGTFSSLGQAVSSSSNDVYPGLKKLELSRFELFQPALVLRPGGDGAEHLVVVGCARRSGFPCAASATGFFRLRPCSLRSRREPLVPYRSLTSPTATCRSAPAAASSPRRPEPGPDCRRSPQPVEPRCATLDGSANYLIAAVCAVVGQGAAPICASSTIARAEAVLDGAGPSRATVPLLPQESHSNHVP